MTQTDANVPWYESLLDRGMFPEPLLRWGIRRRLAERLDRERRGTTDERDARFRAFVEGLRESPIARDTDAANRQHYEVPPEFFRLVLGPRLKYSCAYWPAGVSTLAQAEEAMLRLTCERARIEDGQEILDLGCGWGSFSLWVCEKYPDCRVLAVSNSAPQREFIMARARERGFTNLEVVTADANVFTTERRFDRIVSVEMMEHMKNYDALLERLSSFLNERGLLFVHIFTHREVAYHFEGDDWIGRYFFTGGTMPSDDLLLHFTRSVRAVEHWRVGGEHYQRTAEEWVRLMDERREAVMGVLTSAYGRDEAPKWFERWRVFFIACAELWGFRNGNEWIVSHYLFEPVQASVEHAVR